MKNTTTSSNYAARERKASWHAGLWALAWGISGPSSYLAIEHTLDFMPFIGAISLCVSTAIGLGMTAVYIRLLSQP